MSESVMKFWLRMIFAVVFLCRITAVAGGEKFAGTEEMQKFFSKIMTTKSVSAKFVQQRKIKGLKYAARIAGRFYMKSDGRIAWIVETPVKYYCVITPHSIRQFDREAASETTVDLKKHPAFAAMVEMMTGFFAGKGFAGCNAVIRSVRQIVLLPGKGSFAGDMLKEIELTLSEKRDCIEKVVVTALNGDRTDLQFNDTRVNIDIPESVWNDIRF